MRIRWKTLVILGLTALILISIVYVVSQKMMLDGIASFEVEEAESNAARFLKNYDITLQNLNSTARDWAAWDDTYRFVEDGNSEYVESNLVDETFINLQLNAMFFINQSHQLVFGKTFDLINETEIQLQDNQTKQILENDFLFTDNPEQMEGGLILFDGVPMMVVSHPILTSLHEGPIRGTLIMGRYLDKSSLESLAEVVGLPIAVAVLDQSNMSEDFEVASASLSEDKPFTTQVLNNTHIAGYVLLQDVTGTPILVARVTSDRTAYIQGVNGFSYALVSFIIIGVVSCMVTLFLMERFVLSRLSRLSRSVANVNAISDKLEHIRLDGNDELTNLASKINNMLDAIQLSRTALKEHAENLEKRVEERTRVLKENQEKLNSILSASPNAITATDLKGNIIECNEQTAKLYGYERRELVGKSALSLIAEKDIPRVRLNIEKAMRNGEIASLECTLTKSDGSEFPAEISASLVRDFNGNGIGAVIISRDLTQRKEIEKRLFKSERLAVIGELAGMVGHDLRNPLTGIRTAAYFIKKKKAAMMDATSQEMLEVIDKAVEYANKIVNDLLDYSKEIHLRLSECSPHALLCGTLSMMQVPNRVKLTDCTLNKPLMRIDKDKMERVFTNLIKNSFDAMPQGGTLKITSVQEGGNVEISFADTSTGISEENLKLIFRPLFTTKAQGMGFGLAICKRIVETHGGKITVETAVGKGTTFTVTLPVNPRIDERAEPEWIMPQEYLVMTEI